MLFQLLAGIDYGYNFINEIKRAGKNIELMTCSNRKCVLVFKRINIFLGEC